MECVKLHAFWASAHGKRECLASFLLFLLPVVPTAILGGVVKRKISTPVRH